MVVAREKVQIFAMHEDFVAADLLFLQNTECDQGLKIRRSRLIPR